MNIGGILRSLRRLADADRLARETATTAAPLLAASLRKTLTAGHTPEGKVWAPRRADGGRAYAHAAAYVEVKALGELLVATLKGPEVYGHYGRGGIELRQMIPDGSTGIPHSVEVVLRQAADRVFRGAAK